MDPRANCPLSSVRIHKRHIYSLMQIRHADSSEAPDMEKLLDAQLKDLQAANSNDPEILQRHDKVKELKEKLWECQNPGEKH